LVNYVVKADQLILKARELARQCIECDPLTLKFAKRALHYGSSVSLEAAIVNEQRSVVLLKQEQAVNKIR